MCIHIDCEGVIAQHQLDDANIQLMFSNPFQHGDGILRQQYYQLAHRANMYIYQKDSHRSIHIVGPPT